MRPLTADLDLFDRLASRAGSTLISLFIPTHNKGPDVTQGPIRLKNEVAAADDILQSLGWSTHQRDRHLSPALGLLDDREFWIHQSAGLGVYVDEDSATTPVSLPVGVEPGHYVGEVFHMRHLVPSMGLARVPILALTMGRVRLFEGTKLEMTELDADLPASMEDVNWFVDREKGRQQHSEGAGGFRGRHGHDPSERAGEDRDRFLRAVSEALPEDARRGPLVVVGDDHLVKRFQAMAEFETVSPENSGVGNPESDPLIHQIARPAIVELEVAAEAKALEQAKSLLPVERATDSLLAALPAAVSGRVARVVVHRIAKPVWGTFDRESLRVEKHDSMHQGDVDLIDRLVVEAHRTGASVTTVAAEVGHDSLIATYRY